jgi:hypothetical protein
MADPIPINSSTYDAMNTAILDIITLGNYASIRIFTDASGIEYHSDEFGTIHDRIILSITKTDSYLDASGNPTNAYVIVTFQNLDGTPGGQFVINLTTVDNIDSHWYTLTSIPVPPFIFSLRSKTR